MLKGLIRSLTTSDEKLAAEWHEEIRRSRKMPIEEARREVEAASNIQFYPAQTAFETRLSLSSTTREFFEEFERVEVHGGTGITISRSLVQREPFEREGKASIPFIKIGEGLDCVLYVRGGQSPRVYIDEDDIDEDTILHNWYGSVWHVLLQVADVEPWSRLQ